MVIKIDGKKVGIFKEPDLIGPTLAKIKTNQFDWKLMDKVVERAAPYQVFKLYEGFSHWCHCGQIDMET